LTAVCLICFPNKMELLKQESLPRKVIGCYGCLGFRQENSQPSSSESLTHKKSSQVLVADASCSLSPGQPDASLPANLTAILLF